MSSGFWFAVASVLSVSQHCSSSTEQAIDLAGHDCCGGIQTLNTTQHCCLACQKQANAGCRFWTYAAELKHCYLKSSDAGRRKSSGHTSGAMGVSPNASCPRVLEPAASPHPPLPAGQYRFPYNNSFIIKNIGDGCPDIDIYKFGNGAEACPAVWQDECSTKKGSDEDVQFCECGTPSAGGKVQKGCYQCTGQPHHLQRKPCNVTAWKENDLCGRYPPITRRQIIERALGWVSNMASSTAHSSHQEARQRLAARRTRQSAHSIPTSLCVMGFWKCRGKQTTRTRAQARRSRGRRKRSTASMCGPAIGCILGTTCKCSVGG